MNRDDDRAWAELIDSFNAAPPPSDTPPAWPEAENVDPAADADDDAPHDDVRYLDSHDVLDDYADVNVEDGPGEHTHRPTADDHFVPPTPAPIPRGDLVSRLAWVGVIFGPSFLILVTALSWRPPDELLLFAVGAFVAGFVTLIARLRGHHPNDPDNGAVV